MADNDAKTVLVTGGNRGIGEDISRRFLDRGCRVINISRQPPAFDHELLENIEVDLADRLATRQAADEIAGKHDVTAFIHNAGVIRPDLLEDVKLEDLDFLTELHVGSAIALSQAVIPSMKRAEFGRIVLISSRGVLGLATRTNYAATKAAQIGLVRTWALELAGHGITVNAVAPGPVETDMFHELIPERSEQKKKVAESVPVKRVGNPADVGRVVEFLCEPDSSFITGQTWFVCGGASLGSLAL